MTIETNNENNLRITTALSITTLATATLVIITWVIKKPALLAFGETNSPMSPGAASLFLLISLGTLYKAYRPWERVKQIVFTLFILLYSTIFLVQHVLGLGGSMERAVLDEITGPGGFPIGIMTPIGSLWATLLVGALLLAVLHSPKTPLTLASALLSLIIAAGGAVFLLWYLFGRPPIPHLVHFPPSILSTLCFTMLGTATLFLVTPHISNLQIFSTSAVRQSLFWSIVPTFITIIIFDNLISRSLLPNLTGQEAAWIFSKSIFSSLFFSLLIISITWHLGDKIEQTHSALQKSEKKLNESDSLIKQASLQLQLLDRISHIVLSLLPLESALETVVEDISEATGYPIVSIEQYDAARQVMIFGIYSSKGALQQRTPFQVPVNETVSGRVAISGIPLFSNDVSADPQYNNPILRELSIKSFICIPLFMDEKVWGVLSLAGPDVRLTSQTFNEWVIRLGSFISVLIARRHSMNQLVKSETIFRSVIEQSHEGIMIIDASGHILAWNSGMTSITGRSREYALSRTMEQLYLEFLPTAWSGPRHPTDIDSMIKNLPSITGSATPTFEMQLFFPGITAPKIVETSVFAIDETTGPLTCIMMRDISTRKQTEEQMAWQLHVEELLATLHASLISNNMSIGNLASLVLENAKKLTNSEHGFVSIIDPWNKENVAYTLTEMMDECQIHIESRRVAFPISPDGTYPSLWGYALNMRQMFFTNTPSQHPASVGIPEMHVPIEKFLSVPVMLGNDLVGQIALANPGRDYTERDLAGVQKLAEAYALAIQRLRWEDSLSLRLSQLSLLNETAKSITSLMNIDQIFTSAVEMTSTLFEYFHVGIFQLNKADELVMKANAGQYRHIFPPGHSIPLGKGMVGHCAATGKMYLVNNVRADPYYINPAPDKMLTRSELAVPIRSKEKILGVLDVQSPHLNAFDADDTAVIETLAGQIATAIENARLYQTVQDELNERIRIEQALSDSETQYRELFTRMKEGFAMHQPIFGADGTVKDFSYVRVNPAFEELTGISTEQVLGKTLRQVFPDIDTMFYTEYSRVAISGQPAMFETYIQSLDKYYLVSAFRLETGETANIFMDISQIKQNEKKLKEMLLEKEVLLKEIHHRVKNNLQVIISLLGLRSDQIEDPAALQVFQDCQNSVRAIALIHERIYQSANLAQISAPEYISSLVEYLTGVFSEDVFAVDINLDIAPLVLDLDSAIPCGLIVTELFTNALKHAFPQPYNPEAPIQSLWIKFYDNGSGYTLILHDNGIGLPAGFSVQNTSSLGLQLVSLLTQKLDGNLEFHNQGGAYFELNFPYPATDQ